MRAMRVDVIGGGPGGLFLARLLRLRDPATRVRVYERNGPDDAFGFGIVFSDRTMSSFRAADPHTHALIQEASVSWTDMEIRLPSGRLRYGGYGFTAISRHRLLRLLQDQARRAGAELCFHHPWSADPATDAALDQDAVLVIADGANSANRDARAAALGTSVTTAGAKFIWFGTEAAFDAVTFPFVPTTFGTFAAHAYPCADGLSTFIVEADERTWRASGMAETGDLAPGETDDMSLKLLADIFSDHLDGHGLIGNNSRWNSFRVVRNDHWSTGGAVLLGDAAHTAHFSVGSGTKLAMEDAVALAEALIDEEHRGDAFARYETRRRPAVARTQALADSSMRWWATFDRRMHMPPHRFGTHFITRTTAIDYAGLVRRHGDRIQDAEKEFARLSGRSSRPGEDNGAPHALTTPLRLGSLALDGRVAVRLPSTPSAHHWLEDGYAVGADLLLADWRGAEAEVRRGVWRDSAVRMACRGASLGVLVDPAMIDESGRDAVAGSGAQLVVLMCDDHCALPSAGTLVAD
ncbi:MAG: FAD-dependent monooxygenase, partial [Actinomycetota bacterium]|nr:FAD-dependent monooxygenase [Actinomycetota bacterium]